LFLLHHSAVIPFPYGEPAPPYQQEAISWLKRFKNTELLQQLLARFKFSEAEIAAYRNHWAAWLKRKAEWY
jgi:hypothetical protein